MMTSLTRRTMLKAGLMAGSAALFPLPAMARVAHPAAASWIDGAAPAVSLGQTFGMAWPQGTLRDSARLGAGAVPVQSWTTAWWPDGSVKWTAHAVAADARPDRVTIAPGRAAAPAQAVRVEEGADVIRILSGALVWEIGRSGPALVRRASQNGRDVLGAVRLVAGVAPHASGDASTPLESRITRAVIEQRGPVRAVVKLEGWHQGAGRQLLPFVVRLYAYAGTFALKMVHSFIYDGDPAKDFITALGVETAVPLAAAPHDRHVRIALADDRMFAEAVRPLTGLRRDPGKAFREAQVAGRAVPPMAEMAPNVAKALEHIPMWGDFRLNQLSAGGATLEKRTRAGHAFVPAAQARHAPGLAYVGTPAGGAAIAMRWFRERHPTALTITDAAGDVARLTAWLWSADVPAMDLRSYRGVDGMEGYAAQNAGLDITYEDYEPGWDDAHGIARTNELTLWAVPATPDTQSLQAMANAVATPPQLMADPAVLKAADVLGIWGLPDRSTPSRARIEDRLAELTAFYADEVERRHWLGFWDHGDVMHSYDADRRQWRYDIGGFAWANSELSPDLWLWYQALRTRDARTFRLAEAMTRHTGEVDVYHLGRFKGLGTRHGVQHFSDSSKQPRVSTAVYRRIFYYLTADDRAGDLMRDLLESESVLETVDIGRKIPGREPQKAEPGVIGMAFGTVWCSLAAAWLTEWERTRDRRWRDRLVAGMQTIGALPTGWFAGAAPFELASGRFRNPGPVISFSHLNAVFGAVEINAELLQLLDVPAYRRAWLDYCRWYNAPRAEFEQKFGPRRGSSNLKQGHSRLTGYAAAQSGDAALARRAAQEFWGAEAGMPIPASDPRREVAPGIVEWPGVSTNGASQLGLAAIQLLAMVPEALDR